MFSKEYRPLKRPRLGVPDYYPQDSKQKEDELSYHSVTNGYRSLSVLPPGEEFKGALKDFNQHFLTTKEYCLKVNQVEDERRRRRWVQDSEKKKLQVTKDNFFPVPLGRNRKEIATQWFQDLASSKPLSQLAKKVPIFNKKEEIFDNLCEKDVPISRAAWYIKMSSAYNVVMTDSKLTKKKQTTDPSFDWTISLTKYMQDSVWRICNESQVMGRHDTHGGRTSSTSGRQSPSDETLLEITHWQYMLHLSSWLYEENLLDKHEFIRWLVDRVEHVKSADTKALQLHLPLVLRHLLDIANCVSLARPLVTYCCERLVALYEMEHRLHKIHPLVKPEPSLERVLETNEDDSVFSESSIKQEPGRAYKDSRSLKMSTPEKKEDRTPAPVISGPNDDDLYFHWCSHHQAVMLELVCVIQTIAIRCPTAFVQIKMPGGRGILMREGDKISSPLTILPCSLSQLPMPTSIKPDLQKKLLSGLVAAEAEITQRNKASESRWSSMTVADLQTTSEGSNVKQILKLLDVLDKSSFISCRAHNPLTTLYCQIAEVQRSSDAPLSDEMLTMLLCKWTTTPHRYGDHRPLVTAQILWQRQNDIIRGEGWNESYDMDHLDEGWEESGGVERLCDTPYPLQHILIKFLDTRAPLPDDLSAPMQPTEPFFKLVVLFAELIRLDVFSYRLFLCTLIARGESRPPIIPCLPFARDGDSDKSRKRQHSEPLNLSIPLSLPTIKKLRCDQSEVNIASGPNSPMSSSFGGIGLTSALDSLITSSSPIYQQDDESTTIMEDRAKKLRMLEHESSQLSQIMSPMGFNTLATDTDAPNSPIATSKTDPFNFSLSLLDDDHVLDLPLNMHSSRHLLFAAYFPIADSQLSHQCSNERNIVLCGVGKSRNKVEAIVRKTTEAVEHYYRLLSDIQTPVLPEEERLRSMMTSYQCLPTFEQNVIATSCEKKLRRSLSPSGKIYPGCAQLVFVCELLKVCGSISQILQLLVDIIACNAFIGEDEESRRFMDPHRGPPPLPTELRLPVIGVLQRYSSCLMLSQQDTAVVFEGLFRILSASPKSPSSHKTVFLFLHKLYTDCSYLQKTFRSTNFGNYCVQYGDKFGLSTEWYKPTFTEGDWQRTNILQMLSKPSNCDISSLCTMLKPGMAPYFNATFVFAVDVFSLACQKTVNCEMLSQLAFICAEVCCDRGVSVNSELLGAFRALCIPNQSNTKTGFTALTNKSNILMDPGIHSSLLVFVCLLISHNIFHLQDVIVYIITAVIHVQFSGSSHQNHRSLEFVTSLIVHLLVPDYSEGHPNAEHSPAVRLPPFVQDTLHSKCRELNLGYVVLLLKNLLKISHTNVSRGTKTGSLLVQSSGPGNEATLSKVRATLETVASQDWVQDKCSMQGSRLLESDMLGDTSLTPSQARYLLHLLCPYSTTALPSDCGKLAKTDPHPSLEHILKNLDQWTLRNALLHIDVHVQQATVIARTSLQDHLASVVIHIFEDSCGDEFLGQTIECSVESGDGSYSPRVWLVTPLISQLTQSVLGRVLKSAGNILGQGQWWNPEKNQEKRRSTRATSGVAPPKTGLQWQQPFLELVLACMHAQTNTHEELLHPLKSQLSTFLNAFDREGTPADEQSKTMLFAAIKLRLSLVGSMLGSICSSEIFTLEWVPLIMQLICSGAVDRQTDTSELFTNCLDMLCTLLHSLPFEFHNCLATAGEEGKKTYITCVKKLKSELNGAKSYCVGEIQQLFPLSQEAYTITTVKQPDSVSLKTSFNTYTERIKGLRVQDTRDISPWDILEGVKSNGPLMLSWFGGVRVKRKPLRFEEQRWLLRFHTHQDQFKDMMYRPSFVKLPEAVAAEVSDAKLPEDGQTPMVEGGKMLVREAKVGDPKSMGQLGPGATNQPLPSQVIPRVPIQINPQQQVHSLRPNIVPRPMQPGINAQHAAALERMYHQPGTSMNDRQAILNQIRQRAIYQQAMRNRTGQPYAPRPPVYTQQRMMAPNMISTYNNNPAVVQRMMLQQHHEKKVMEQRLQQQQRAQMAMQGQFPAGYHHPGLQGGGMQPMQANPPVPMHQVMHQGGYSRAMMPQQGPGNMMVPGNQPRMQQYPPQHPSMNTMHRQF